MKLWKKISLLTAVVLFIAMGIFGGGMLYETWKYNLNQTVSSYQQQMKVNSYVIAQEINNNPLSRFSEVTRKSFLNYTVQKYGGTDYILLKNGQEVVNLTGYTLVSGEDARFNDQDPAYVLQKTDNRHLLVMGQTLKTEKKGNLKFQLILVKDISGIYEEMTKQMWLFIMIYLVVIFFAVDIVFWLVRMVLKPLTELENTAGALSRGDWERRCRVRRNDEIGKVSVAFNRMADKMEEQMEELETVSERRRQLLGSLTHELKTPMTSIIGYSDTLLHVKISEEQQKKALEHINSECRRLERLSGKMMTLIGLYDEDRIHKEPYPVDRLVREVADLECYHMQDSQMELLAFSESWECEMDVDLMESLLVNLLDNAIKHTKEDGFIRIKTEAAPEGVWFSVEDNGTGIEEVIKDRIFDEFVTFRPVNRDTGKGIGLGLAICKAIVTAHGGTIEALNREEGGACFRFYLPFDGHLPEKEQ